MNSNCISSNVLKTSVISQVRSTIEITDIFNTFDEIVYFFRFFFSSHFSLTLLGSARLADTILGVNAVCT